MRPEILNPLFAEVEVLKGIGSVVILQRQPRMGGVGDVFQYTSYVPGAKLVTILCTAGGLPSALPASR